MILIYTHNISPRAQYTIDLVFGTVLGIAYRITNDSAEYVMSDLPKLAYTVENLNSGMFLESSNLLFEADMRKQRPVKTGEYKGFPIFFPCGSTSCLPYDLFATVFYTATRYEEYVASDSDRHGRFVGETSLEYGHKLLQRPFLNELILDFSELLQKQFPALTFAKKTFAFLSTIDIDNVFAYAHKGLMRNVGGLAKDLLAFDFARVRERLAANANEQKDPYNTFARINAMARETATRLQYFVLIGDYAAYDKNPHHANRGFRKVLQSLSVEFPVGLHPSYRSGDDPALIAEEKRRLEAVIGKPVTSARCHFLRVRFPETYRAFLETGITDDYTMIYASQCGFRTGLCVPYRWFDLRRNEVTALTIHTSTVMEGTLRDYNGLSPADAQHEALSLMEQVKHVGGEFISIFHNDSFVPAQHAWVSLYQTLLSKSKQ